MLTDAKLLTITQWLSPAFPTGAFAYSHGLEAAIQKGWVTDPDGLRDWLRDCLTEGSGRADAIWLRLAYASEAPLEINCHARAFIISHERLREAERQGAAFVDTVNTVWGFDVPPLLLPVAVGHAARRANLDIDATVGIYLQSFCANLVSAALRLMPMGQTAGQSVIHDLQDTCLGLVAETQDACIDDVFGNAFLSDIAAMVHETQEPRLFQS